MARVAAMQVQGNPPGSNTLLNKSIAKGRVSQVEQSSSGFLALKPLTVRKDGDTVVVCIGKYNCVRVKSCDPQHLARAIKLLNIHDVAYVLGAIKCTNTYSEVMRILEGEGYV
jgi:hypothetical protein